MPNPTDASMIDLTLVVHDPRWRQLLPDTEQFARSAIMATLKRAPNNVPPGKDGQLPEIACLFTNDTEIQSLNKQFRGKDSPTNVLSFPADISAPIPVGQPIIIGDLILSVDTIEREAREQGKPFANHTAHMLVHGVLHLLGFDHEEDMDAEAMEGVEREILSTLGIRDPYAVMGTDGLVV